MISIPSYHRNWYLTSGPSESEAFLPIACKNPSPRLRLHMEKDFIYNEGWSEENAMPALLASTRTRTHYLQRIIHTVIIRNLLCL